MADKAAWDWEGFERDVADALGASAEGDILVLQDRGTGRYVQLLVGENGTVHAEVSSNAFLEGRHALGDRQLNALEDLGWKAPEKGGSPNLHRTFEGREASRAAAHLAVTSIIDVLEAASPLRLAYDAFNDRRGRLELPGLGLPRLGRDPALSFPAKPDVVVRWAYCLDSNSEYGGFSSGEFALLADGRLFRRSAHSSSRKLGGEWVTEWHAGHWELEKALPLPVDVRALMDHLKSFGYDLYRPTPIPIDADSVGPFSERPHLGEPL